MGENNTGSHEAAKTLRDWGMLLKTKKWEKAIGKTGGY